ncbi:Do family serine endopeptidase [Rhizobium sp. C4]|uniref:Do family serine endopeptidase n=1 Tax=Rhizobium sp. C4 TaxID=1349800 RepID=UPI001E4CB00E|nr:Do family serine endopeptidase [Rhizobium sp. C4]MCD2173182.1 Do family serine endopeptidase [Rhizobium sp. C4]
MLIMPAMPVQAQSAAVQQRGPASVADLAEGLLDAVVNISISQDAEGSDSDSGSPSPKVQKDAPFEQYFNDYFNKRKKDGGKNRKVNSLGSGFVIDTAGYIVTNNHVIEGADEIDVNFADGTTLEAKLIGTDTKTDLAVLKVEPKAPLKAVKFGDSRKMRIGDWVMAVGNPFGLGGTVTVGIVSARGRNINAGPYDNFIQTDAAINKGNSGGPLFDMEGDVIGVNTAIISPTGGSIGIGFSIPSEIAMNVIEQLKTYGETRRGWLGVRLQPVTDDMVKTLGMDKARGAMVASVIAGGPVENGPIKSGDVIVSFDGRPVKQARDLPLIVAESPIDKDLQVVVMRDGKETTVTVRLKQMAKDAEDDTEAAPEALDDGGSSDEVKPQKPGKPEKPHDGDKAVSPDGPVLGMSLKALNDDLRKQFSIEKSVEGVVVAEVEPGSPASEKGIVAGDVIVEIAQEFISTPADAAAKITSLKQADRRNAQVMVSNNKGDLRFVAIRLE